MTQSAKAYVEQIRATLCAASSRLSIGNYREVVEYVEAMAGDMRAGWRPEDHIADSGKKVDK